MENSTTSRKFEVMVRVTNGVITLPWKFLKNWYALLTKIRTYGLKTIFLGSALLATGLGIKLIMKILSSRKVKAALNRIRDKLGRIWFSKLIEMCASKVLIDNRRQFKELEIGIKHAVSGNHSHLKSATDRCKANTFMEMFAAATGRIPYHHSCSEAQNAKSLLNSRFYYHAKDLAQPMKNDKLSDDNVIVMTDVDYYVDMPGIMQGNDIMLYTFIPQSVAGYLTDGSYVVNEYDELVCHINGGAKYKHKLWDYSSDHLIVDHWWGSVLYLLETRYVSETTRMVYMNCRRKVYGPIGWFVPGVRLARKSFVCGEIVHNKYQRKVNDKVEVVHSFAHLNSSNSVDVSEDLLQALKIRVDRSKDPTISDVERLLKTLEVENASVKAPMLLVIITNIQLDELFLKVMSTIHGQSTVVNYQAVGPLATEDGKPSLRVLPNAYSRDMCAPVTSYNNDVAAVKGRVTDIANRNVELPPAFYSWMVEFIDKLLGDNRGTLVPYDYNNIYQRFNRPTQRTLLNRCKEWFYTEAARVRSFVKKEPYGKITNPRVISTLPTSHNAVLGQIVQAFSDHVLKKQDWYAFGRHPTDVTRYIMDRAANTSVIQSKDVTRMDGSHGKASALLVEAALVGAFAPEYREEVRDAFRKERYTIGVTKNGYKYEIETQNNSGSSATTLYNTLPSAFMDYCSNRRMMDSKSAWEALGVYGGDDSLSFDGDVLFQKHIHAKMGFVLKVDEYKPGEAVPFLGRYYLNPWTTPDNVCDMKRQIRKLHLTSAVATIPDELVMRRKAEGLMITDPRTPFLGEWARAVVRITTAIPEKYAKMLENQTSYWAKYDRPFTNNASTDALSLFWIINTSLDYSVCTKAENAFRKATKISDLDIGYLWDETPQVEIEAATGDEIRKPNKTTTVYDQLDTELKKALSFPVLPKYELIPNESIKKILETARVDIGDKNKYHARPKQGGSRNAKQTRKVVKTEGVSVHPNPGYKLNNTQNASKRKPKTPKTTAQGVKSSAAATEPKGANHE
jgi:hypothetical protein